MLTWIGSQRSTRQIKVINNIQAMNSTKNSSKFKLIIWPKQEFSPSVITSSIRQVSCVLFKSRHLLLFQQEGLSFLVGSNLFLIIDLQRYCLYYHCVVIYNTSELIDEKYYW